MAELILKVGDNKSPKGYMDDDIICAFSDRHISCVNAQNICNHRNIGFKTNGLRDIAALTFKMFSEFYQYKFERVSDKEVKRTLLSNGTFELFSNTTEKQIHASEYIKRRLKHDQHLIFGDTGSEIWFGGKSDFSQTKIDNVWTQITANTGLLKADHDLWPIGFQDPIDFLPIKLDADITDEEADTLIESIIVTEIVDDEEQEVMLVKRKRFSVWQDYDVISPITIAQINNVNTKVDGRRKSELNLATILEVKHD